MGKSTWWGCVGPDKLYLGCRDRDVSVRLGVPNANVSCPFLVCPAWKGGSGPWGLEQCQWNLIEPCVSCLLLSSDLVLVYSKPGGVPGMLQVGLLSVQFAPYFLHELPTSLCAGWKWVSMAVSASGLCLAVFYLWTKWTVLNRSLGCVSPFSVNLLKL